VLILYNKFKKKKNNNNNRCGPCKMIGPIFVKMADEFPDCEFVKVDVDDAEDIAQACGIQAMPTFQLFKGGNKVDELQGADAAGLKAKVTKNK
jgi:thioredoxin 1